MMPHSMGMVLSAPKKQSKQRPQRTKNPPPAVAWMVLVCGVAACLAVGVLAMQKIMPNDQAAIQHSAQQQPAAVTATATAAQTATPDAASQSAPEYTGKKIDERDLQGDWTARFLDYVTLFQVRDGAYQILVTRTDPGQTRYYSRGTYKVDGSTITLTPKDSMGEPEAKDPTANFMRLTSRAFTIKLVLDDGALIWWSGDVDPQYPLRKPMHPLISYSGQDFLLFERGQ